VRARVTRVEISSRQDVLNGKAFGTVGAYEKLAGTVYFTVDPNNAHNKIIADIDKAPRNSEGRVEFSADLFILRPKDPSHSNGVALFDVVNRGGKGLLGVFNRAKGSSDPTAETEFGDGLLMREGYTLVAVGWEFEVRKGRDKNLVGLQAPIATENGQPITGWISPWFIPDKASVSFDYTSEYNTDVYPPLDPKSLAYRLTVREGWVATPRLIPREDWQFGRLENGKIVFDPNWLTVKGGIKAGQTYQLTYESKNPPVAGLGFAAIRDMASAIKNNSDAIVHARVPVNDDVTKGNDSRMFGDPRRNFGIVLRKASEGLADDTELALDRGAQNFIRTVLLKGFSRAKCRDAVRSLPYVEEIFPRFKPHKARSSPAPRAAGNRGYRGWLE